MVTINSNTHDYFSRNIEQMWQPCQTPLLVSNHSVIPFAILKYLSGHTRDSMHWPPERETVRVASTGILNINSWHPLTHKVLYSPLVIFTPLLLFDSQDSWTCGGKTGKGPGLPHRSFEFLGTLLPMNFEQATLSFSVKYLTLFNPMWKPNGMVHPKIINYENRYSNTCS